MHMLFHTFTTVGIVLKLFLDCFCKNEKAVVKRTQEDIYDPIIGKAISRRSRIWGQYSCANMSPWGDSLHRSHCS